jgi:hypothetical protein
VKASRSTRGDFGFEPVLRSLTAWRKKRKSGARIPEHIWEQAVELTEVHGVSKTAKRLHLDFSRLRKRVEERGAFERSRESEGGFVEVVPGGLLTGPECLIEIEDPRGTRLRVSLSGRGTVEAASVIAAAWEAATR